MIITLLTDFGLADHYVAAMKGVILSYDSRIQLVDISHEVPAYDRWRAAFLLASCHAAFPPGTVHLVVVDPGVGSSRRPLAIHARGSHFVGPDNGVLPPSVRGASDLRAVEIDPRAVRTTEPSATFHGRDIFAPTAAALAMGTPLERLGRTVTEMIELDRGAPEALEGGILEGSIIHIDRFGNCITSFQPQDFPGGDWQPYVFQAAGFVVDRKARYYDEGDESLPFVLPGSTGYLELALRGGAAAESLGLRRGDPVRAIPKDASRVAN